MELSLEAQWEQFMSNPNSNVFDHSINSYISQNNSKRERTKKIPPCSTNLKISTKSKIIYLNKTFNLNDLFWKVPVVNYDDECEGIIKKQMKFNFTSLDEVQEFEEKIKQERFVKTKIINQINNPTGRVQFKDVRKIDVGFSKNDLLKPKKTSKSAFYNCFVIVFRKKYHGLYREFHTKLFNSGKVEIPGIQTDEMLELVVTFLVSTLQQYGHNDLTELKDKRELVLVNSNFNCQYYLNRESLLDIFKTKYHIKCNMDSCSYPGIQCKYKIMDNDVEKEVSFMIFRTGSVLIVGKCNDDQLNEIYNFLVKVFHDEFHNIYEEQSELEIIEKNKIKNKKKTKKGFTIYI